jgi:hypothetical protein
MRDLSLPGLEAHLDKLRGAQSLTLARSQIERFFRLNDLAEEQLSRFAQSHKCLAGHSDNCVVFQKVQSRR